MANHQYCENGSNYTAPVLVIGLYIAGGSLLCFLLMLWDIGAAWRQYKRWVPCSLFSLNSLTLSLLSIVAKLPVDLTSPMPSAFDQLSKLTGTTIICIYMALFLPSIGTMGASECFSNVAALTIFVVTVIVNICIQIRTGVIFSLIVEHVIILCFMFLLLMLFWCCALDVNSKTGVYSGGIKNLLLEGKGFSMVQRLRLCYFYSYVSEPQFAVCRSNYGQITGFVSTICTFVLSKAVIQSLLLKDNKLCEGHSDYRWSISIVVVIQIVTVILGFLVTLFRWVTLIHHMNLLTDRVPMIFMRGRGILLLLPYIMLVGLSFMIMHLSMIMLRMVVCGKICFQGMDDVDAEGFQGQLEANRIYVEKALQVKAVDDFNRWKKKIVIKYPSTGSLQVTKLLFTNFPPSHYQLPYRLSCLSVVLLVREVLKQLHHVQLAESLQHSLKEVFGIIFFIDQKINALFFESKEKLDMAVEIWSALGTNADSFRRNFECQMVSFREEEHEIRGIVNRILQSSSDLEDRGNQVRKQFVEMLNWFFCKLPKAIFKDVVDSPPASYNDRVKVYLKHIHILSSLENQVEWKFPSATDITSLITDNNSQESLQLIPEVEQDNATVGGASQRMEEGGASQQMEEGGPYQQMEEGNRDDQTFSEMQQV